MFTFFLLLLVIHEAAGCTCCTTLPNGETYDLDSLTTEAPGGWRVNLGGDTELMVSFCAQVNSPCTEPSAVCLNASGMFLSTGALTPAPEWSANPSGGVQLQYPGGDKCPSDPNTQLTTVINLLCSTGSSVIMDGSENGCQYMVVMKSMNGCPVSSSSSYSSSSTASTGGTLSVSSSSSATSSTSSSTSSANSTTSSSSTSTTGTGSDSTTATFASTGGLEASGSAQPRTCDWSGRWHGKDLDFHFYSDGSVTYYQWVPTADKSLDCSLDQQGTWEFDDNPSRILVTWEECSGTGLCTLVYCPPESPWIIAAEVNDCSLLLFLPEDGNVYLVPLKRPFPVWAIVILALSGVAVLAGIAFAVRRWRIRRSQAFLYEQA